MWLLKRRNVKPFWVDVFLEYVRDTPVLKLGALFKIDFSRIFLLLFAKAFREGFIFSFMIPWGNTSHVESASWAV